MEIAKLLSLLSIPTNSTDKPVEHIETKAVINNLINPSSKLQTTIIGGNAAKTVTNAHGKAAFIANCISEKVVSRLTIINLTKNATNVTAIATTITA